MTHQADNLALVAYSAAYATGRSAFALQSKSKVAIERSEIAEGLREQWNVCLVKTGLTKIVMAKGWMQRGMVLNLKWRWCYEAI